MRDTFIENVYIIQRLYMYQMIKIGTKKITSEAKHFLEKIINESEHIDF